VQIREHLPLRGLVLTMAKPQPPKLLEGFIYLEQLADELKLHKRTLIRWTLKPDGLPFSWIGQRKVIHVATAREWLFNRMRRPAPRRDRVGTRRREQARISENV
jgi:hypothetical protein